MLQEIPMVRTRLACLTRAQFDALVIGLPWQRIGTQKRNRVGVNSFGDMLAHKWR